MLSEASDLACYHAVNRKRQKWDAREAQLLELLRSRARPDEVPRVELMSALATDNLVAGSVHGAYH